MAILSISELIDIVIMTFAVGYIFLESIRVPRENYEPLNYIRRFDWKQLFISALIVSPGIILHELAHKFVAMGFGANASFNAAYMFLAIGILMKLIGLGFIFFVPAYVSIQGHATYLESALTSIAGPLANLILWVICWGLLRTKFINKRYKKFIPALIIAKKINMLLFVFNIIPIPGFDGYHFLVEIVNWIRGI